MRADGKGYGNAGSMESVEKQKQLFPSFHSPLGISPKERDSHIPTAWHRPGWKSGKPKRGFPLSHAGLATTTTVCLYLEPNTKARRSARFAASPFHISISRCIGNANRSRKLLAATAIDAVQQAQSWLAAVGRTRYGPRTADVRTLLARASRLTPAEGASLVTAAGALGLTDRLWPHGTDPDEDDVLRVSAALAARDATEAARAAGASARTQSAVASFARVLALAPAFGPAEAARLLRPWRDLDAGPDRMQRPRRVDER